MWPLYTYLIDILYKDTENFKEMDLMDQMHLRAFFFVIECIENEMKPLCPNDKKTKIKLIEEIMNERLANSDATDAAVLVMNPNTSEVIAMTSLPGYDPADYGKVPSAASYINQVTEVPYEPPSICKNFAYSAVAYN